MQRTIRALAAAILFGFGAVASADDKPAEKAKAGPLELSVTGKKTEYTLDSGGLSAADYKERLRAIAKGGQRPPATPTVELVVEIKNISDQPVTVWTSGDPFILDLKLSGKGAMNLAPLLAMTQEFRIPTSTTIAPGKSHTIPIKSLTSGMRGISKYAYWTEPGEYELVAELRTGVSPAPKGAQDAGEGFGVVTLKSEPFKVTVVEKK